MTVAPAEASATLTPACENAAISAKLTVAVETPAMLAPENLIVLTGQANGDAVTDGEMDGVAAVVGATEALLVVERDPEGLLDSEVVLDADAATLIVGDWLHVAESDTLAVAVGLDDAVLDVVGQLPR